MRQLKLSKAFTLMESGPVVLVTTHDGEKDNIMTISWTRVVDFTPLFAITTGTWNDGADFSRLFLGVRAIAARHGLRIAGDTAVDLDAVTGAQGGVRLDQPAEDADLLRLEIDVGKLLEDARALDGLAHRRGVGHFNVEPDLLAGFRVGYADLHAQASMG